MFKGDHEDMNYAPDDQLSTSEIADLLGVGPKYVQSWLRDGLLPYVIKPMKTRPGAFVRWDDLLVFLAEKYKPVVRERGRPRPLNAWFEKKKRS